MTTKKIAAANAKSKDAATREASPTHRLDALLHTMRCITQYEDALCELSHELKGAGSLSDEAGAELQAILEKIPAQEYIADLEMVRESLAEPRAAVRLNAKTPEPLATGRKGVADAKKKAGRVGEKFGDKAGKKAGSKKVGRMSSK